MEYFYVVSAGEFSLCFELPAWENIILQGTLAEPALHHAALAIGALTRSRYYPDVWQTPRAIAFSIQHYSMAIQDLHCRLDQSSQGLEVAVLASIVFSYIEFLLGIDSRVDVHIQAGCALLKNLYTRPDRRPDRTLAVPTQAESNCQMGILSTRYDLLASAMSQLTAQLNHSMEFQSSSISQ
jgi:hypothetical protein